MRVHLRLGVLFTGVFVILIGSLLIGMLLDLKSRSADFMDSFRWEVTASTYRTAYQLQEPVTLDNSDDVEKRLRMRESESTTGRIRIYNLDGALLVEMNPDTTINYPQVTGADLDRVRNIRDVLFLPDTVQRRFRIMLPLFYREVLTNVIVHDVAWGTYYDAFYLAGLQQILIKLIPVIITGIVLLLLLWNWIYTPLQALQRLMKAAIAGGAPERAQPFLAQELHQLALTVNEMLDSVDKRERAKESELRRHMEMDLELRRYRDQLEQLVETRTAALQQSEETSREFQEYLKRLNQTSMEFSRLGSQDAICRYAVETGLARFGFDRMGLFLINPETQQMTGTYGTGADGELRDEHDYQATLSEQGDWLNQILSQSQRAQIWQDTNLFDYGKVLTRGWRGRAALWDGDDAIGYFSVDNLIHQRPPRAYEQELLSLFGAAIGNAITRQRAIEERLASEMRFRAFLENAPVAIFLFNAAGNIILSNHTADTLFQYSGATGLTNQSIHTILPALWSCFPDETWQNFFTLDTLEQAQLTSFGHDLYGVRQKGMHFSAEIVLTSTLLGNERAALAFVMDMSQYRQAEKQRLELSLERERTTILSRFIRDAAHEFGTPLSIIRTALYVMSKKQDDAIILGEQQNRIRQQADHIHRLVNVLTTMARLDSTVYGDFETINLYEISSAIAEEYADQAPISIVTENAQLWIKGHLVDMTLAIRHVIENAIRYAPEKEITIELKQQHGQAVLRVSDSGEGMPEEVLNRVFERFYRGDDSHSTRGFGLGLSIVRRVVELHAGHIAIESLPGAGTHVSITLPLAETRPANRLAATPQN